MAGTSGHATMSCCKDFALFQDILKGMRTLDDKVVYALNTSIPTDSFAGGIDVKMKCKSLCSELTKAHSDRLETINTCIRYKQEKVEKLRKERQANMDDVQIQSKLRKEQTTLRLMQSELMIEEVVKKRSMKIFKEKCRIHYDPADDDTS